MLADFLFGPLRTRVLSALILHPDADWHARELARRIGALPGSASRELVKLAGAGILTRQQTGNQVHYRANPDCPIFSELALVFGSVARGEEATHSDVDVLVRGNVGFAEVLQALHPVQAEVLSVQMRDAMRDGKPASSWVPHLQKQARSSSIRHPNASTDRWARCQNGGGTRRFAQTAQHQ